MKNNTLCNNGENLVIQKANSSTNKITKNIFCQTGDRKNIRIEDSINNKTLNVISNNISSQNDSLSNKLPSKNTAQTIQFADMKKQDYTVIHVGSDSDYGYLKNIATSVATPTPRPTTTFTSVLR